MRTAETTVFLQVKAVEKGCTIIEITCIPCRPLQLLFIHKVISAGKLHISASSTLESATYAVCGTLINNRKKMGHFASW